MICNDKQKHLSAKQLSLLWSRESLGSYAISQWQNYRLAPHHKLICKKLRAVEQGICKRLMIFCPPRAGKSMLTSEFFPAWYLGRNPDKYVIFSTYGQELADDFGRKVRNQLLDPMHQEIFPGCRIREDSTSARRFHTEQGGVYYAVGAGGAITGRGAHLLLIDDPVKGREDADSETQRRKLKDWYTSVAYTRLMPNGAIIVIQTRWHEDDLAGWLMSEHEHENWEILNLPAIAEPTEERPDALGRQTGQALWEECYPVERLLGIKATIGSRDWVSLYQQRPSPDEGNIFDRNNWQYWEVLPDKIDQYVLSVDSAFKSTADSDFVVLQVWGVKGSSYYLIDQVRDRMGFVATRMAIQQICAKYPQIRAKLIEDKANGSAIIDSLDRTISGLIPINPGSDSKVARARSVSPYVEAKNVYLPANASWVGDFVEEMAAFPNATHDDQVDAMTQVINWVEGKFSKSALAYY